jgi:two-component system nitrate/nitrite sensor histidine kinase NarX
MHNPRLPAKIKLWFAQLIAFFITIGFAFGLWRLTNGNQWSSINIYMFWLVTLIFAVSVSFLARTSAHHIESSQRYKISFEENSQKQEMLTKQLDGVIRINQLLIDAKNERELIDSALEVIADITEALGSSFVPFDEWGIALTPYTFGSFPPLVLKAWAEHLSSTSVRQKCHSCTNLDVTGREPCILLGTPFADRSIHIYCLPLERSERRVGMLNLYLPSGRILPDDQLAFIRGILHEMVLAIEAIRLRNQELATLRQLQMVSKQREDIRESINQLVDGLKEVIDFHGVCVEIKAANPHFPGLHLEMGDVTWFKSEEFHRILSNAMQGNLATANQRVSVQYNDYVGTILAISIYLSDGAAIGAMILTADPETFLQRQQLSLIETVASQVAMLVENQRSQLDIQFRIVMQERIRLSREIHDSLAQTLAYLKLTAAQMQNQLTHGDLTRLEQTLNQSYQALSEAYLETREVIDNLRTLPKQSIADLLRQVTHDFEITSGLKVDLNFPSSVPEVKPELQAQILRVVQEALSNVRKHANAQTVQISLSVWNRQLSIEISDDGVGFDAEDVPGISRHGLQGMRERAELIGADFQIISQAGQGTCIRVQIPVTLEEKQP